MTIKEIKQNEKQGPSKGNILRVKQGYNPNSSSIGSIIFALPAALLGVTAGFGAVSGIIMGAFANKSPSKKKSESETELDESLRQLMEENQ
ncbi:MAG: hypothetical protein ACYSWP_00180 [Planctomycetota bacterium]|jgi:hypothetical protein